MFLRPRGNLNEEEMRTFRDLNRLYWELEGQENAEAIGNLTESCIEPGESRNRLYYLIFDIARKSGLYREEESLFS